MSLATAVSFNPNYFAVFQKSTEVGFCRTVAEWRKQPVKKDHEGNMSKSATKRLSNAVNWLLYFSQDKEAWNYKTKSKFKFKLNLITLTLPFAQMHTDQFIKAKLLNNFFQNCRNRFNLKHYIWRAEKQANGNIHFHILTNLYLHHEDVRNIWNKQLENYGYIDAYRVKQESFYQGKFRVNEKFLSRYTVSQQRALYKRGKSCNWSNPNSTDIHSLSKINNIKAYLTKYLTKNINLKNEITKKISKQFGTGVNLAETSPEYNKIRNEVIRRIAVTGRLWFISNPLSKIKNVYEFCDARLVREIISLKKKFIDKVIQKDFVDVFCLSIKELREQGYLHLCSVFDYLIEPYKLLFS